MENIFNKKLVIEKTKKHLSDAKYVEQFSVESRYSPKDEWKFLAGKTSYDSRGTKIERTFEKKYEISLTVTKPRINLFLLPFYKLFPVEYRIKISVGSGYDGYYQTIKVNKEEFEGIINVYMENYERILHYTIDKSFFDDEPDIFEKTKVYSFQKQKTPLKDYILRKKLVKY